jgi:hypothetical protein
MSSQIGTQHAGLILVTLRKLGVIVDNFLVSIFAASQFGNITSHKATDVQNNINLLVVVMSAFVGNCS